jgi:hypothetical protein
VTLSGTGTGAILTAGDVFSNGGAIAFDANTVMNGNIQLISGGGNVGFTGSLNGPQDLYVDTGGGDASFAAVGGGAALTDILIFANDITFNAVLAVDSGNVSLVNTGLLTLSGPVNMTNGTSFTQQGGGSTLLDGVFTGTGGGAIAFIDSLTIASGDSGLIDTSSGNGSVNLAGGVVGGGPGTDLTITAGSGSISLTSASSLVTLDADTTGLVFLNGGAITVGTFTTTMGSLDVASNTTLQTTAALNLSTVGSLTGGGDLDATSAGVITVDSTSMSGALNLTSTAGVNLAAGTINAGSFSVTGNTTLTGASSIATSGNVSFSGTVDGPHALTVTSGGGTVDFNAAVGGGVGGALSSLTLTGTALAVTSVETTGNQSYSGDLEIAGVLQSTTANTGLLTFNDGVTVMADSQLIADNMDFNGAAGSVVSSGGLFSLLIAPQTQSTPPNPGGRDIIIDDAAGLSATELVISGQVFDGFGGTLFIGGTTIPVPLAVGDVFVFANDITINSGIDVGSTGSLYVLATGDIILATNDADLTGSLVALVGVTATSEIISLITTNLVTGPTITANTTILGAPQGIGTTGEDIVINAAGQPSASIQIATSTSTVFVAFTPTSIVPTTGASTVSAAPIIVYADYGVTLGQVSGSITITNTGQSSAAKEQSGGLVDEGFIDPSLFEEIKLYEEAGTGIALPADQREEECTDPNDPSCENAQEPAATTP